MEDQTGKSAAERYEAARIIDEGCGRAMEACVDMIDAVVAIDARNELHAVRDALLRLHAVATGVFEDASRMRQN